MQKTIEVKSLKPGMQVVALDGEGASLPFLAQKFVIDSPDDVIQLMKYCERVVIEITSDESTSQIKEEKIKTYIKKEAKNNIKETIPIVERRQISLPKKTSQKQKTPEKTPLQNNQEKKHQQRIVKDRINALKAKVPVEYAQESFSETLHELDHLFADVRGGGKIHKEELDQSINHLLISAIAQPDTLSFISQVTGKDNSLARKSTDVCILSLLFARYLGMETDQLRILGLGALLHDIGMLKVPETLLKQTDVLSVGQRLIIQKHVEDGRALVGRVDGLKEIDSIVAYHHERFDGMGYPIGLKGKKIPLMARILAITTAYEAMTRNRLYHASDSPTHALSKLYKLRNYNFDGALVTHFIRAIGVYPVGTLVQLNDLSIAIVVTVHPDERSKPIIKPILTVEGGTAEGSETIDLCRTEKLHILRTVELEELSPKKIAILEAQLQQDQLH